ncbi:hypothetical protein ACS229_27735, partial [Klebsiella pneumoniae]|uniref:hypothetical protein n=1 Tax=Klebsiella pneumoniae TaxID=573 RepID=UPI003F1F506B
MFSALHGVGRGDDAAAGIDIGAATQGEQREAHLLDGHCVMPVNAMVHVDQAPLQPEVAHGHHIGAIGIRAIAESDGIR